MAPRVMRCLFVLSVGLWVYAVAIGESSTIVSDEVETARIDARTRQFDAISVEPEINPTDNPGRRRRADARRRTHQPTQTAAQKQADELQTRLAMAKRWKVAQEKQTKKAIQDEQIIRLEKKQKLGVAKALVERSTKTRAKRVQEEMRATAESRNLFVRTAYLTKEFNVAKAKDAKVKHKTRVLTSAVAEALRYIKDAVGFMQAVKNGQGDKAYRKSFLFREHKEQGVGGMGGLAKLVGAQFNVPWLVSLNKKLSNAMIDTTYENLIIAQKALDTAAEHESALERKWKVNEAHRAKANEALLKDAHVREKRAKVQRTQELIKERDSELSQKRAAKIKRMVALKLKTDNLMKEGKEIEEKMLFAAGDPKNQIEGMKPVTPTSGGPTSGGRGSTGPRSPPASPSAVDRQQKKEQEQAMKDAEERARARAEGVDDDDKELLKDSQGGGTEAAAKLLEKARQSQMMAKHFHEKELTSKSEVRKSEIRGQELKKEEHK